MALGLNDEIDRIKANLASNLSSKLKDRQKARSQLGYFGKLEAAGIDDEGLDPTNPEERSRIVNMMSGRSILSQEASAKAKRLRPDLFDKDKKAPLGEPIGLDQAEKERRRRYLSMAGSEEEEY